MISQQNLNIQIILEFHLNWFDIFYEHFQGIQQKKISLLALLAMSQVSIVSMDVRRKILIA